MTPTPQVRQRRYWQATLKATAWLLLAWFAVTFGVAYFARDLDFDFLGWPFSFWVGAQGAVVVYCLIVWIHARVMARLDARLGSDDSGA